MGCVNNKVRLVNRPGFILYMAIYRRKCRFGFDFFLNNGSKKWGLYIFEDDETYDLKYQEAENSEQEELELIRLFIERNKITRNLLSAIANSRPYENWDDDWTDIFDTENTIIPNLVPKMSLDELLFGAV